MDMSALPSSIAGFTIVPVAYSTSSTHILYARSHVGSKKIKNKNFPDGRTLFLVNVPPDATERELILFFKHCGTVERVIFDSDEEIRQQEQADEDSDSDAEMDDDVEEVDGQSGPRKKQKVSKNGGTRVPKVIPLPAKPLRIFRRTGRSAHIIFLDSSSVDRAVLPSQKPRPWPSSEEPSGLSHYIAQYDSLRPPLDAVRAHADSWMEAFEYELAKTRRAQTKYKKGEAIVDEDGFTLVVRGGAYGQTVGGGVGVASKTFQKTGQTRGGRTRNKKEKVKQKEGFYAFEKAEKQRKGMCSLPFVLLAPVH
jgi:ribosomal RNA-processing protein 7